MIYTETLVNKIFRDMLSEESKFYSSTSLSVINLREKKTNVEKFYTKISNNYDKKFLYDIGQKLEMGKSISSKQLDLIHKILPKYRNLLLTFKINKNDLDDWLDNFYHNLKVYKSKNIEKEVRYLGNNILFFRFLYNPEIIAFFKKLYKKQSQQFRYSKRLHGVNVLVNDTNKSILMNIISNFSFKFDNEVEEYFLKQFNSVRTQFIIVENGDNFNLTIENISFLKNWLDYNFLMSDNK